ncbi:MAG: hypothetical protein ACJ76Y_30115 [Thermoanaerobaculia bacterium]
MTQRKIRCTVIATGLAAVLTLAAPAQAASHARRTAGSGWLDTVWHWVAGFRIEGGASNTVQGKIPGQKADKGYGIDPDGSRVTTQPANPADKGYGIDPDG